MKNEKQKEIKYFSMFAGVGGFELGIEQSNKTKSEQFTKECDSSYKQGKSFSSSKLVSPKPNTFNCIGFSEIDKYASELLKQKFPSVKNYGDATKIIPSKLPDFNLLVGGFPCQAFSIAGKRRGFEDTRGTLFYDIARILKIKRPEYILLENVKGLLSHDRGRTFGTIIATLSELGYVVQWMVLNSKFFGVPQNRERIFIIGSLRGKPIPEILPLGESNQNFNEKSPETILDINQAQRVYNPNGTSITIKGLGGGQGAKTGLYAVLTPNRPEKRQQGRRFKNEGEPSFTLTSQDVHGVAIMDLYNKKEHTDRSPALTEPHHNTLRVREGLRIRRLTPTECERLQGFPDGWTEGFSDTQRYKMMGNAVTVNVIKAVIGEMFK